MAPLLGDLAAVHYSEPDRVSVRDARRMARPLPPPAMARCSSQVVMERAGAAEPPRAPLAAGRLRSVTFSGAPQRMRLSSVASGAAGSVADSAQEGMPSEGVPGEGTPQSVDVRRLRGSSAESGNSLGGDGCDQSVQLNGSADVARGVRLSEQHLNGDATAAPSAAVGAAGGAEGTAGTEPVAHEEPADGSDSEPQLINFRKWLRTWRGARELLRFQRATFGRQRDTLLFALIAAIPRLPDPVMAALSKLREPTEAQLDLLRLHALNELFAV